MNGSVSSGSRITGWLIKRKKNSLTISADTIWPLICWSLFIWSASCVFALKVNIYRAETEAEAVFSDEITKASTQQPINDCLVTRKCNQLIWYRFLNRAQMLVLFQSWRDGLCACRSVSISHWPLGNLPCIDNLVHSAMNVSKINITEKSFINVYTYFQILKCFLYTSWNIWVKWFEDILQTWDKKGYRIAKIKVYAAICWINLLRGILLLPFSDRMFVCFSSIT